MRYVYISFCLALLLCHRLQAQCTWTTVGSGATSSATTTTYLSLAMAPGDVPYLAYCDASQGNAPVVKSYSGGAWTNVDSLSTFTSSAYTSLKFNGSVPYLAFADGSNGGKATVKMYSGGAWTTVGTAVSTGTCSYLSLAIYNNIPYLLYSDGSNSNRATVKTYSAGAWTTLGTAISTGTASYTSLSISQAGTPYVIYQDAANSNMATVKQYNGSAWVAVGTGTVATGTATETRIDASYNGTPYIAYLSGSSCIIKNFIAAAWQPVGTGTFSSAYAALALAVDGAGMPYIGYYDLGSGLYKSSVMKYNGSAWAYAGNSGISIGVPGYHSLAVTSGGTPYIAISDGTNGSFVKKLSNSTITTQPASTSVCAGNTAMLAVATNSTGSSYQWQQLSGTSYTNVANGSSYSGAATATLSVLSPGTGFSGNVYRCIVNDNCTNLISTSASLTVNPLPSLSVANATICAGTSKTLTATGSGAATYSWSTGSTSSVTVVSPTVTSSYVVTGTSALGCSANATAIVSTISSKVLGGSVSSSAGAVSGNMILYRYKPALGLWDSVTFTPFSSIYSFGPVDSSLYVVKAVPTATTFLVTYGSSAISWKGATTVSHGCTNNTSHNVQVIGLTNIGSGSGSMSGSVLEGQGFGQRPSSPYSPLAPGQPIKGVTVKGGKNPGGNMFAQTTTAADGTYTLSGLPDNAAGESYFLLVDMPGLDTNQTYHKILQVGSNQYDHLDFVVDSAKINPVPYAVGIREQEASEPSLLQVFPNPASSRLTIRYELKASATVSIGISDISGRLVRTIVAGKQLLPGRYEQSEAVLDLDSGLYFIHTDIGSLQSTYKCFITH